MARKRSTKGKVQHNKRVRFCTLDYYRTLVTNKSSDIEGINWYICTDYWIKVVYENGAMFIYDVNEGENQLKQVVKEINAYLGGKFNGTQQQ